MQKTKSDNPSGGSSSGNGSNNGEHTNDDGPPVSL